MGRPKAMLRLAGTTFLERALDVSAQRPTAVVIGPDASPEMRALLTAAKRVSVVENASPELGMSRSLALASEALARPASPLAVLLVDTPLVTRALLERIYGELGEADVAFPVRGGVAGHPVIFGATVRASFARLPVGDTLRTLRDAPGMRRVAVPTDDDAPFVDIDTEAAYAALAGA